MELFAPSRELLQRFDAQGRVLTNDKALPCPDLLSALPDTITHARVLLLEAPDPLTLLASIAGCPPHVKSVDVVLHHSSGPQAARLALLLLLAAELDPGSAAHMEMLWDVLANAVWPKGEAWWQQLGGKDGFIQRLLDGRCESLPLGRWWAAARAAPLMRCACGQAQIRRQAGERADYHRA